MPADCMNRKMALVSTKKNYQLGKKSLKKKFLDTFNQLPGDKYCDAISLHHFTPHSLPLQQGS